MFYGRVDVYWPDGPVESYRLDKPSIAVGRSTGNDIVLDTTAISRYHITLTVDDQQVHLRDLESVNGTYVDGVLLATNEPFVLRGGEEIQIGDIRLIYHPPMDMTSLSEDTTQRVVLSQPTYRVELEGPDMAVAPGAHVQALLKIENVGDVPDRYVVDVSGLPGGWVRVDRVELELGPGEQGQALISLKPLRKSESQPGKHPFSVRVRSRSNPGSSIEAPAALEVLPFSGFGIALGNARVKTDETFRLYVHNQGNAPLSLLIRGAAPGHTLAFHLPTSRLTLGPGEHRALVGTVRPRRPRWLGGDREHEFALVAQAQDASRFVAAVPGRYLEKSVLPVWAPALMLPLLAVIVLLVAGAALLLLSGEDDEPTPVQPVIGAFSVSSPTLTLGETLEVTWSVSEAQRLELMINSEAGSQVIPLDPAARAYGVMFDETGRYRLELVAHNGELPARIVAEVEVRPRVALSLAVTDAGGQLVRFVSNTVQVGWQVEGAREFDGQRDIWVEGSGSPVPLIDSPQPASGSEGVPVVPGAQESEWLVTLHAEGLDGVRASVTQKLPIVNPVCELIADEVVIREGPGEAYPPILTPPSGGDAGTLSFSPVARDPDGRWLRVPVGVGDESRLGWVPLADFNCTNFDPAMLRPSYDFAPLPVTPTPTPVPVTPTAPPLPTRVTIATATPVVTADADAS